MSPDKYGRDILAGKIAVCEYARMAVQRHYDDLEREDFPYYFDEEAGMRPIRFFEKLKHGEGDFVGQQFEPMGWQAFVCYMFFGWKRTNGKRKYWKLYVEVPRKNGKTTFLAALALYHLAMENKGSSAIYCAATKERQARECLDAARNIAMQSPALSKRINVTKHWIESKVGSGFMRAIGSDSDKTDGLKPSMIVVDELHAHKTFDLFDKLNTAFGMRSEPFLASITTAGNNRNFPCYEYREDAIKVLKGIIPREELLPFIFTLDEEDDWKDADVWAKANPSWGVMNREYIKTQCEQAQNSPMFENSFKNLHLNVWTDSETAWVSDDDWMANCGEEIDLIGRECYAGVDLAITDDITALVLMFEVDGIYHVKPWFWIPEKKVLERQDRVNYRLWQEQGFMRVMPGGAIDLRVFTNDLLEILTNYNVKMIAFDRWYSHGVVKDLINNGIPEDKLLPIGQGFKDAAGPIQEFSRRINLRHLAHYGNPVLRWMCNNIAINMDAAGNVKFDKSKSTDKIDGMVALSMAIGAEMHHEEQPEIDGNIRFL